MKHNANLISYKDARIEALLKRVNELETQNEQLTTWVFELTMDECPDEYKQVIRNEVLKDE
jgi:hypothetical protein